MSMRNSKMRKFKTGDKVRLKSGGIVMTMSNYYSNKETETQLTCQWFDKKEIKSFGFFEDQLELVI